MCCEPVASSTSSLAADAFENPFPFSLGKPCASPPLQRPSFFSRLVADDPYFFSRNRISAERFLLFLHFFAVAFYSIWIMFTHPRPVSMNEKVVMKRPGVEEYPFLLVKAVRVVSDFYGPESGA